MSEQRHRVKCEKHKDTFLSDEICAYCLTEDHEDLADPESDLVAVVVANVLDTFAKTGSDVEARQKLAKIFQDRREYPRHDG